MVSIKRLAKRAEIGEYPCYQRLMSFYFLLQLLYFDIHLKLIILGPITSIMAKSQLMIRPLVFLFIHSILRYGTFETLLGCYDVSCVADWWLKSFGWRHRWFAFSQWWFCQWYVFSSVAWPEFILALDEALGGAQTMHYLLTWQKSNFRCVRSIGQRF